MLELREERGRWRGKERVRVGREEVEGEALREVDKGDNLIVTIAQHVSYTEYKVCACLCLH